MKNKLILLLSTPLFLCSCLMQTITITPKYCYGGIPVVEGEKNIFNKDRYKYLLKEGFEVLYDRHKKNPKWVAYKLVGGERLPVKRYSGHFKTDRQLTNLTSSKWLVKHDDFTGSGYHRGHMAPVQAIASRYGETANRGTYILSNVCPQKATLNSGIWAQFEEHISKTLAPAVSEVWVITGTVFDDEKELIKNKIEIPDAFYKIVITEESGTIHVMAVMIPQDIEKGHKFVEFFVSVDEIEEATGIDFLPALDDEIEDALERTR